jgi:hypothetical protein
MEHLASSDLSVTSRLHHANEVLSATESCSPEETLSMTNSIYDYILTMFISFVNVLSGQ